MCLCFFLASLLTSFYCACLFGLSVLNDSFYIVVFCCFNVDPVLRMSFGFVDKGRIDMNRKFGFYSLFLLDVVCACLDEGEGGSWS